VFVAVEGHVGQEGFSYHLAGEEVRQTVELAVDFQGGGPVTLAIALDASAWLKDLNLSKSANSTHSRPGDALALSLAERTPAAFSALDVRYDTFHPGRAQVATAAPKGTTPYHPQITERFAAPSLPADNPLTQEGVALGEALFHDNLLSRPSTQSCASCHKQELAFADNQDISPGAENQKGSRNAMPLFNLAWHKAFFWDGRAPTLRQQVLLPIQDKHEMNAPLDLVVERLREDDRYPAEFERAFGSPGVTADRIAMALEQYLLTLVSQDSKFDRAVRKQAELTAQEKRGLELFLTEHDPVRGLRGADCFHCHGGTLFTQHNFTNNGLALATGDLGLAKVTQQASDEGKFKTPSLRNVALTAPYMHDGRFATLEDVVEHYSTGIKRSATLDPNLAKHPTGGLNLSAEDKAALVAFLHTLTDETFTKQNLRHQLATTR
jgi:cytochrome c peroxidase